MESSGEITGVSSPPARGAAAGVVVGSYRYLAQHVEKAGECPEWEWGVEAWLAERGLGGELAGHRERMLGEIGRRVGRALGVLERVSVHGPATVPPSGRVVEKLTRLGVDVVVHASAVGRKRRWRGMGGRLLVENMDKRGAVGRSTEEMALVLRDLEEARVCLDVSHTLEVDPTGRLAMEIGEAFRGRIGEVHVGCGGGEDRSGEMLGDLESSLAVELVRREGVALVVERAYAPGELERVAMALREAILEAK